jgi:hypothetical protein
VSEFVEECRREWRRLGVPDPVANEMAADLTADLEEADAEGGSPEDVLGNSAFDPRRFAAAWAVARGVTGPPNRERRSLWRPPVAIVLTVLLGALTVGAGLALLVSLRGRSFAVATRRIVVGPGPIRLFPPGVGRIVVPGPLGPFVGTPMGGIDIHPLAWMLLIVGVVGLGLLALLYSSPWSGPRRYDRHGAPRNSVSGR